MPVKLETFQSADTFTAQDNIDLIKLYADHPLADNLPLVTEALEQGGVFYAARFNDRILGGLVLTPKQDSWYLSHLYVRNITRRRHVAQDLLRELLKLPGLADKRCIECTLPSGSISADCQTEVQNFLVAQGFAVQGDSYQLPLAT
jgi:hypothetical protein